MKHLILLLFLSTLKVLGQVDTLYFSDEFYLSETRQHSYYRIVVAFDSINLQIRDYYLDGKKYAVGYSKHYPNIWFYRKEGRYVSYHKSGNIKESASYRDGDPIGIKKEFFQNGKPYRVSFYSGEKVENKDLDVTTREIYDSLGNHLVKSGFGKATEYLEEWGGVIETGYYKEGRKDSVWTGCYKNGSLCYTESYDNGKLKKGFSRDTLGVEHEYDIVMKLPRYKTNSKYEFYEFLGKNIEYPEIARRLNVEGKAFIKFIVTKEGKIKDCSSLKPIFPDFVKEAIRVIKKSSGKWEIGYLRGIPINTTFTQPVAFVLE